MLTGSLDYPSGPTPRKNRIAQNSDEARELALGSATLGTVAKNTRRKGIQLSWLASE
ncbi:MAG: hypothetical protein M3Y24_10095 [Acidobacteriota bacterium]|nr:hypothetical protein [Acidobacteriota bacterium]